MYTNETLEKALNVKINWYGEKISLRVALGREFFQLIEESDRYSPKRSIFGVHFDNLGPVFLFMEPEGVVKSYIEDDWEQFEIIDHKKANSILRDIINYAFLPIEDKKI